jgi:hypothetical protein
LFDWAALVVAVLALVTAGFAAWFASDQVSVARDTEHRQLRAYIFVTQAGTTGLSTTKPTEAHVVIRNSGQTPAYDLSIRAGVWLREFPLAGPLPQQTATARIPLGPGSDYKLEGDIHRQLTDQEIAEVNNGSKAIYVYES